MQTFTGADLAALRATTSQFIAMAPNSIALIPTQKVLQPAGGYKTADGPARPAQNFKLIALSSSERPQETGPDTGVERQHSFILLGEWDATVRPGDHWVDTDGIRYEVVAMVPYNGYEVRAEVAASGEVM